MRGAAEALLRRRSSLALLALLALAAPLHPVHGGSCWIMAKNGRCMQRLSDDVDRDHCCKMDMPGMSHLAAYVDEKMDSGTIFFYRALGGGVPCAACKDSCERVECGAEMKCVMRNGRPKCVCEPKCPKQGRHQRGAVCGSDGRSYRNACRLRKRACRQRSADTLSVAYHGQCQDSCSKVRCLERKQCVVDQNKMPHCVRCSRKCGKEARKHVCGADGHTYPSVCHIRVAACRKGKAVPIAYRGRCKPGASCRNVKCRERQRCLLEPETGHPRCVSCSLRCRGEKDDAYGFGGPICGTNNISYRTWCHLLQDACSTGFVIETKHIGNCTDASQLHGRNSSMSNSLFSEIFAPS